MAIVIKEITVRTTIEKSLNNTPALTHEWKEQIRHEIKEQLRWNELHSDKKKER